MILLFQIMKDYKKKGFYKIPVLNSSFKKYVVFYSKYESDSSQLPFHGTYMIYEKYVCADDRGKVLLRKRTSVGISLSLNI